MTTPVPDIIESWINKIIFSECVKNLTDNGDGTSTFDTCNTWWALECNSLKINGIDYPIVSIVRDTSITITGLPVDPTPAKFVWTLDLPFFIHGTPRQTNAERDLKRENLVQVTPMVYLFEPITERFNKEMSAKPREFDVKIAFLNNYNDNQFTGDIYDYSIRAMRKLAEYFVYTLKKQVKDVHQDDVTYKITSYAKYGQYIDKSGSKKNIFNENLSGVELNLSVMLKSEQICVNLCNC